MRAIPLPKDAAARAEVLRQFGGLWVAVWQDQVVAAGRTPDEVFREIDEKRLPDAAVTRIPDPERGIPVGLG